MAAAAARASGQRQRQAGEPAYGGRAERRHQREQPPREADVLAERQRRPELLGRGGHQIEEQGHREPPDEAGHEPAPGGAREEAEQREARRGREGDADGEGHAHAVRVPEVAVDVVVEVAEAKEELPGDQVVGGRVVAVGE